jgi:glutamine amidotransferase-like uncharacterized protein
MLSNSVLIHITATLLIQNCFFWEIDVHAVIYIGGGDVKYDQTKKKVAVKKKKKIKSYELYIHFLYCLSPLSRHLFESS